MMDQPVTVLPKSDQTKLNTLFQNARKEAVIILAVWLIALLWTVLFCYLSGYTNSDTMNRETVSITCGIPTWVFWGVAFPWGIADIFTIWFCLFYMKDDDLGAVQEDEVSLKQSNQTAKKEGGK